MTAKKQLVLITGMSGSGKSLAASTFEDLDFYCIDNLPPQLLAETTKLWLPPNQPQDVAIVADVRAGQFFPQLAEMCKQAQQEESAVFSRPIVLFMNASDSELIKRFKETRRKHPLVTKDRSIGDAIALEREMLADLSENSDKTIDTTNMEPEAMRRQIREIFGRAPVLERLMISVVSFGFKYGVPLDADVVFDVRFLANPYWVESLRSLDGTHPHVRQYVDQDPIAEVLLKKLFDLVEFSIPQYIREGKAYLTIAIGCTGGRHRSVVIADELNMFLRSGGYTVRVEHRDLMRHRGNASCESSQS